MADAADIIALAGRLRPFGGTVWTSPARRCRDVAAALGPHRVDCRLQELDFGAWEDQAWDELWGFRPPGGETGGELVARVQAFYGALPAGTHVVISHGGPLKVLAALLRGECVDLAAPAPLPGSVTPYERTTREKPKDKSAGLCPAPERG